MVHKYVEVFVLTSASGSAAPAAGGRCPPPSAAGRTSAAHTDLPECHTFVSKLNFCV